jgi:hypothetical protein
MTWESSVSMATSMAHPYRWLHIAVAMHNRTVGHCYFTLNHLREENEDEVINENGHHVLPYY